MNNSMAEDCISIAVLLNNENIPKDIFTSSVDDYFGPQVEDFKESSLSVCILSESTGLAPSKYNAATFSKSQWLYQTKFAPNQNFEFRLVICDNRTWNIILSEDSEVNRLIETFAVESDKTIVVHLEWNKPHTVSVESLLELHSMDESLIKSHYENQEALESFKNLETITEDNFDNESLIDSLQECDKQSEENKEDSDESEDLFEPEKAPSIDKNQCFDLKISDSNNTDNVEKPLDSNSNSEAQLTDCIEKINSDELLLNENSEKNKDFSKLPNPSIRKSILLAKVQSIMGVKSELDRIHQNMKTENANSTDTSNFTVERSDVKHEEFEKPVRLSANSDNSMDEFSQEPIAEKNKISYPKTSFEEEVMDEEPKNESLEFDKLKTAENKTLDNSRNEEVNNSVEIQNNSIDWSQNSFDEREDNQIHSTSNADNKGENENEIDVNDKINLEIKENYSNNESENDVRIKSYPILKDEIISYENIAQIEEYSPENARFNQSNVLQTVCSISISHKYEEDDINYFESPALMNPINNICADFHQELAYHSEICANYNTHNQSDIANEAYNSQLHYLDPENKSPSLLICKPENYTEISTDNLVINEIQNSFIIENGENTAETNISLEETVVEQKDNKEEEINIDNVNIDNVNINEFISEEKNVFENLQICDINETTTEEFYEDHTNKSLDEFVIDEISTDSKNIENEKLQFSDEELSDIHQKDKEMSYDINKIDIIENDHESNETEQNMDKDEKLQNQLEIKIKDESFNIENVSDLEIENLPIIRNATEVVTDENSCYGVTIENEIIMDSPRNKTIPLPIIEQENDKKNNSENMRIYDVITEGKIEEVIIKPDDMSVLESVDEIRLNNTDIIHNSKNENKANLEVLRIIENKSSVIDNKCDSFKLTINENLYLKGTSNLKSKDKVETIQITPEKVNKIKLDNILNKSIEIDKTKSLKENIPAVHIIENDNEIRFDQIILRKNNTVQSDESHKDKEQNDIIPEEKQPRVSEIIEKFENLKQKEFSRPKAPILINNNNPISSHIKIDKYNENENIKEKSKNKEVVEKIENRHIISDKSCNFGIIDKSNIIIANKGEFSCNLVANKSQTNDNNNSEKAPELRLNDDYMYPDSITPTKVEQNLSKSLEYDVPFIDDDIFYKENWYRESNDRWSTLEKSKIVNTEYSLTPVSETTFKSTPKASIETLQEIDVEKLKLSIDSSEPERKKKGLINLCGCVGGRKRS